MGNFTAVSEAKANFSKSCHCQFHAYHSPEVAGVAENEASHPPELRAFSMLFFYSSPFKG